MSSTEKKYQGSSYTVAKTISTQYIVSTAKANDSYRSINTSRRDGTLKLRIASREIPDRKKHNSTT